MSKVNCWVCNLCGEQIGWRDMLFQVFIPKHGKVKFGCPALEMKRYDLCNECMAKISVAITHPETAHREATPWMEKHP